MMAQNSDGPDGASRRLFAQPVAVQLAAAIRAYQAHSPDAHAVLGAAVTAAAADARERGLHPQEVVIALKAVQESAVRESVGAGGDRDTFQSQLLQTMLKAYFGDATADQ